MEQRTEQMEMSLDGDSHETENHKDFGRLIETASDGKQDWHVRVDALSDCDDAWEQMTEGEQRKLIELCFKLKDLESIHTSIRYMADSIFSKYIQGTKFEELRDEGVI